MFSGYEWTPGATVVGCCVKEGVVLAAEKRVSYGFYMISKAGKKVFKINDRMGMACAGLIADMQAIARTLAAEARLYEIEHGRLMPIRAAAKLLSVILFNRRTQPYITETLIGGIDDTGSHLYVLDPIGALIEDRYAAVGSGGAIAIAVLENGYREDLSIKEAEKLCINAVISAIKRDAISGDGVDVLVISRQGCIEKSYSIREVI